MQAIEARQDSAEQYEDALDHYICPDRPSTRGFCGVDLSNATEVIYDEEVTAKTCAMCVLEFERANYHCVICGRAMDNHAAY